MVDKISPDLREEIQLKLEKLARRHSYYEARKRLVLQDVRSLGDIHSFWIENPSLRKQLLRHNYSEKTVRKKAREGIRSVHNGWYFLTHHGQYGMFLNSLDSGLFQRLNGIVAPKIPESGQFRTKDVTLNIGNIYTPTSWERISERFNELLEEVRTLYKEDPLESAILFHLGVAGIQPFRDGNKRCARLVQDRILYDAEMPPAIILAGEGKFYLNLLTKTLPAYRDGDLEGQRQFYDYNASKVNNGLDEILGDLEEEPAIINH